MTLNSRVKRLHISFVFQPGNPPVLGYVVSMWRQNKRGTLKEVRCRTLKGAMTALREFMRLDRRGRMLTIDRLASFKLRTDKMCK
jgi:hypothetical protein